MICPVCSKELPDRTAICPGCRADLSKWKPKKETAKAAPAVILQQKEVFMWSSLPGTFGPFFKPLGYTVLVCALLYGAYKGYMAYALRADNAVAAAADQAEDQSAEEKAPDIQLSTAGFAGVYQEYSARAAALNVPALENGATGYFQAGAGDVDNISFAAMEEAGIIIAEEPLTPEELGRAGQENFVSKCLSGGTTVYLGALPDSNRGRPSCWQLKAGPGAGSPEVKAAGPGAPAEPKWVRAQWLPKLHRWSPWTAEQLIAGAEKFTDKTFATAVLQDEAAGTEALARKLKRQKRKQAAGTDAALLETYKARFRREGALAALDRMRAMTGASPQPVAIPSPAQAQ